MVAPKNALNGLLNLAENDCGKARLLGSMPNPSTPLRGPSDGLETVIIQTHPYLDLSRYPGWKKPIAALGFLTTVLRAIQEKRLRPQRTFHLVDRGEVPVGVSAGDICYPASHQDIRRVSQLVVEFEDRRFFSHRGVDFLGILRAVKTNIMSGRVVQGGSTITQQLVRNTFLSPDRSLTRKLLEIVLALTIERHYSKAEILLLYCQFVYVGPGVRGFQAAAKLLYRRSLDKLDAESLCGLVGLLRRPSRDFPARDEDRFMRRQALMVRIHHANSRDGRDAGSPALLPNPIPVRDLEKPRWTSIARQLCTEHAIPCERVRKIGLTVDRTLQSRIDRVLRSSSRESDVDRIAAVVLSNDNADVLAESVWSKGHDCEFSPSFAGAIQPGSTFKTFAVLAALEEGYSQNLPLRSEPFESSFIRNADGSAWRVRNYGFQYRGAVTLEEALRLSDNAAFAQLTEMMPFDRLRSIYSRFGLTKTGAGTPAIALGGVSVGVSLLRIASAYAAIARNGIYVEPRFIRFVHYSDGSTWWQPRDSRHGSIVSSLSAISRLKTILGTTLPQLKATGFVGKTGTTRNGSLVAVYDDAVSVAVWLSHKRPRSEYDTKSLSAIKVLERMIAEALLGHRRDAFAI